MQWLTGSACTHLDVVASVMMVLGVVAIPMAVATQETTTPNAMGMFLSEATAVGMATRVLIRMVVAEVGRAKGPPRSSSSFDTTAFFLAGDT